MGLLDIHPDNLLPTLVLGLVLVGILTADLFVNIFLSVPAPLPSEDTYFSAKHPEKPQPLPSLFERPSVKISVVIPAYNETKRLLPTLKDTVSHLTSIKGRTFEIIIVDDGSIDGTTPLALGYAIENPQYDIRVIRLENNRMKGGAVKHGVLHSRGERIIFIDADAATRFSDLEVLWREMDDLEEKGTGDVRPAIAVGSRAHLVKTEAVVKRSPIRNFLMYGFHFTLRVLGVGHIRDTQCGFKLFNRLAARALFPTQHLQNWIFDVELLLIAHYLNIPIKEVPVEWHEVPGSKLNIATATIGMVWDLLIMRFSWTFGRWSLEDGKKVFEQERDRLMALRAPTNGSTNGKGQNSAIGQASEDEEDS